VDHESRVHDKRQQDELPGIAYTFQFWLSNNDHVSRAQAYRYLDLQCARYNQEPPAGWLDKVLAPFFPLPGNSTHSPRIETGYTGTLDELAESLGLTDRAPTPPPVTPARPPATPPSPPTQPDWIEEAPAEQEQTKSRVTGSKPRKPKAHDPRLTVKAIQQELIFHWFNASVRRRQQGFTVAKIHKAMSAHDLTSKSERTIRRYLQDMYKAGRLKRWAQPVTLPDGQKITVHWYTSSENPDPKYHLWLVIKRGT
jgi:hypothetical protein